jgi:hypothetical protein
MAAGQGDPMNSPTSSGRKVRAGLFEIDLAAGQLHKNGRRLPLQEQPFRVLATLLEHPGDVVTRQELKERLWPADTYVGFDEGPTPPSASCERPSATQPVIQDSSKLCPGRGIGSSLQSPKPCRRMVCHRAWKCEGMGHRWRATLRLSHRAVRSKLSARQLLRITGGKERELYWSLLFWFWFSPLLHTSCTGILPQVMLPLNAPCLRYYPFKI